MSCSRHRARTGQAFPAPRAGKPMKIHTSGGRHAVLCGVLACAAGGLILCAWNLAPAPAAARAGEKAGARPVTYEADIRPLLAATCLGCHGEDKRKARLDLRGKDSMLKGGESGPALVP